MSEWLAAAYVGALYLRTYLFGTGWVPRKEAPNAFIPEWSGPVMEFIAAQEDAGFEVLRVRVLPFKVGVAGTVFRRNGNG